MIQSSSHKLGVLGMTALSSFYTTRTAYINRKSTQEICRGSFAAVGCPRCVEGMKNGELPASGSQAHHISLKSQDGHLYTPSTQGEQSASVRVWANIMLKQVVFLVMKN